MSKIHNKPWWLPIARFGAHTFVGTIIFLIILAPAVGLNYLVHYLENNASLSPLTIAIFSILDSVITLTDAVLYLIFLAFGLYRAAKEVADE